MVIADVAARLAADRMPVGLDAIGSDEALPAAREAFFGLDAPHPARVIDFLLGGAYNLAADRQLADRLLAAQPRIRACVCRTRGFTARAVRHLAARGVEQFLDLGAGIAARHAVHDVVVGQTPQARVVYVSGDPMTVALNRLLLSGMPGATAVRADPDEPASILAAGVSDLLDLDRPMGIVLVGRFCFGSHAATVRHVVAGLRDAVVSGSWFVLAEAAWDWPPLASGRRFDADLGVPAPSKPERATRVFDGLRLAKPGVAPVDRWRTGHADPVEEPLPVLAGVAVKP